MRNIFIGLITVLAVSCGGSTPAESTPAATPTGPATVAVATNGHLGQILVDGSGRTLYLFEADKGASSTCYSACATYWPPLLTNGAPKAGAGVDATKLATTKRNDGTSQVTYNGHPLYYVVTDHNPGDATGQAVDNFGGLWYVVGANGNKVTG